jgi:hypothetical protein
MILVLGVWAFVRALLVNAAAVSLENVALRHQLAVLQRSVGRARLRRWDRLVWVGLSQLWAGWRASLLIVQPATVDPVENLDKNLQLVEELREQARAKGMTVAQLAIAWVLAKAKDLVPLVGARRRDRSDESLGALDVELGPSDVEQIERTVSPGAAAT